MTRVTTNDRGATNRMGQKAVALILAFLGPAGCRSWDGGGSWERDTVTTFVTRQAEPDHRAGTPSLPRTVTSATAASLDADTVSVGQNGQSSDPNYALPTIPNVCPERPIALSEALVLAGVANPTIALAFEAVRASQAERLQADALLVPSLNAGADYNLHRGNLQTARGLILDVDRQSAYVGGGAAAVGAGTVRVPGVRLVSHIADAVFEPVAAQHRVAGTSLEAIATRNEMLMHVAVRYLELLSAQSRLAALRQSESEFREVVELTANFARAGQGRQADADRAQSEARLLRVEVQRVEEEEAVAAAELARLLDLDPATPLRTAGPLAPVELNPPDAPLEQVTAIALRNRPEIGSSSAGVAFRRTRLREEQVRPFLPLLSVGYSAGGFGGGSDLADTHFGHFDGRGDFDVLAVWSLENLGLGNLAIQRQRRAEVGQAEADRINVIDRVRRETAEAFALVNARRQEIELARRRLEAAAEASQLDLTRARNLEGRPIEVLNSVATLAAGRQELIQAITGFNQAQFRLFVAVGLPPTEALPAAAR